MDAVSEALARTWSDTPDELKSAIAEFWPESEWDNAARISYLESGWKWDAEADTRDADHGCGAIIGVRDGVKISAEHSIGYFQINACVHKEWNQCHLFNARQNAGTAHALWESAGRSWSPWYFSASQLALL